MGEEKKRYDLCCIGKIGGRHCRLIAYYPAKSTILAQDTASQRKIAHYHYIYIYFVAVFLCLVFTFDHCAYDLIML